MSEPTTPYGHIRLVPKDGWPDPSSSRWAEPMARRVEELRAMLAAYRQMTIEEIENSDWGDMQIELDKEGATKVFRLVEALEDLDDVQRVTANFDIPEELFAEVAG